MRFLSSLMEFMFKSTSPFHVTVSLVCALGNLSRHVSWLDLGSLVKTQAKKMTPQKCQDQNEKESYHN